MAAQANPPGEPATKTGIADNPPHADFDRLLTVAAFLGGAPAAHVALAGDNGSVALAGTTWAPGFDDRLHALCAESLAANRQLIVASDARLRRTASPGRPVQGQTGRHRQTAAPPCHVLVPLRMPPGGPTGVLCIQDARADRTDPATLASLEALADELARKAEARRLSDLRRDSAESRARMTDMLIHDAKGVLSCLSWNIEGRNAASPPGPDSTALAKASIAELLNTLDDIGRIQHHNLLDFEPRIALHDLKSWFRSLCDRERIRADRNGVTLETSARLNQQYFNIDLRLLDRIAQNLCANALAASRAGDTVVLALAQTGVGSFCLSVEDEGPGIADEDLSKIFDPYFTRGKRGGTGLGLAICRSAALKLGGRVAYVPRRHKGSRFEFVLYPGETGSANASSPRLPDCDPAERIALLAASGLVLRKPASAASRPRTASLRFLPQGRHAQDRARRRSTTLDRIGRTLAGPGMLAQKPADGLRLIGEMLNDEATVRRGNRDESDRVDGIFVG